MLKKNFVLLFAALLIFAGPALFSQDAEEPAAELPIEPLYRLAGARYEIDGITRENLVRIYMEIKIGCEFYSREELAEYIADKQVHLLNQRTFSEGAVEIDRIEETAEGPDLVYLKVSAKDTWNLILLPYAKYDSNEGLLISLRGRDYNFLGSMQTLALNFDYNYDNLNERNEFSVNGDFSMPFSAWGRDWVFDVGHDLEYVENLPFKFNFNTDLGYFFYLFDERWRFNVSNDYNLNNRDSEDNIADHYFLTSGASVGGPIPTGFSVGRHPVRYSPSISTSGSYVLGSPISEDRRGITGSFSHSIGWGRIDWDGNFRRGYTFSVSNSNSYNFLNEDPAFSFDTTLQAHTRWGWGGLNSRLKGFYQIDAETDDAGGPLRGILDSRIDDVDAGAYLNLDMPFNMWIWFMSHWFEGHLSPFVDAAIFRKTDGSFGSETLWYTAGIEGFAFAKAARSLYLRVSFGFDLKQVIEDGKKPWEEGVPELYIGLGNHY